MRNSINLLPWRETKRLETRRQFYREALIVVVLVVGFVGIAL
ncbi:hypothetical protein [Enterovibrio coralii]|nr:hypothetical protein [Enterovibrio coralii]